MSDLPSPAPTPGEIPPHLEVYLARQRYELYTPMDHAGWRFIMRIGQAFFATHAHAKYLDGIRETGIATERIPRLEEMDAALRRFGWRAVPVIGFIPPAAFLEFQAHGLLPIACDMRKIENLTYTPAPDIVHEAAGHAPIIADPAYAAYLRGYGEISRRAIFSRENMAVYYAIRHLSDTKERPDASPAEIEAAERRLEDRLAEVTYDSEVDWVTRLGWWTTEYGLVGSLDAPKIYGAGLLSSIGESYHCLSDRVRKIPFSLDCIHQPFNITEPQPQLFVTPDFETLSTVLEQLAERLAFRRGGLAGVEAARRGGTVCTVELDNGLQVTGIVEGYEPRDAATATSTEAGQAQPELVRLSGPVMFARSDTRLPGHGPDLHPRGCLALLGRLAGSPRSASDLTPSELAAAGFAASKRGRLEFASGFVVEGILEDRLERDGQNLLLTMGDCVVRRGDEIFHQPSDGRLALASGRAVPSVFGGAADRHAWMQATEIEAYEPGTHKTNATDANRGLNELYAHLRALRESGRAPDAVALSRLVVELDRDFPDDWLLRWELLELNAVRSLRAPWEGEVRRRLQALRQRGGEIAENIDRGLALIEGTVSRQ